jgi:hypothetical protein
MLPIDEWLNAWLSAHDLKKYGQYRDPGPLQVYAATKAGDGPQFSGSLQSWDAHALKLKQQSVQLGLVAVECSPEHAYFKYPGVTLVFEGPTGGSVVARDVMAKLGVLGIGGILAGTEQGGRFGVLRIIMTARWYALTGDKLFGVDWDKLPNDPVHGEEAKKAWALGIHAALRKVLVDIPSAQVDTVRFGAFDVVDWLHDLGPRERTFLYAAKPRQLAEALYKLGSYDLDALSSEKPRPFTEGGPLLTLHDTLGEDVTMEWLRRELASPGCILLHTRGHIGDYGPEILLCLLRRQPDGRVRLATATITPSDSVLVEDCFEVDPDCFQLPLHDNCPIRGADEVLLAFVERYAELHEPGTLFYHAPAISEAGFCQAMVKWFCKSPSAGIDHDLLSHEKLRANPRARASAKEDVQERELTSEEAEELLDWLHAEDQQKLEREWLLTEWELHWGPSGPEPDEIEKFIW